MSKRSSSGRNRTRLSSGHVSLRVLFSCWNNSGSPADDRSVGSFCEVCFIVGFSDVGTLGDSTMLQENWGQHSRLNDNRNCDTPKGGRSGNYIVRAGRQTYDRGRVVVQADMVLNRFDQRTSGRMDGVAAVRKITDAAVLMHDGFRVDLEETIPFNRLDRWRTVNKCRPDRIVGKGDWIGSTAADRKRGHAREKNWQASIHSLFRNPSAPAAPTQN